LRSAPACRFGRAFGLGALAGAAVTAVHLLFLARYVAGHRAELEALRALDIVRADGLLLVIAAPVHWLVLGGLTGGLVVWWRRQRHGG
jgi:hypothetical protein